MALNRTFLESFKICNKKCVLFLKGSIDEINDSMDLIEKIKAKFSSESI